MHQYDALCKEYILKRNGFAENYVIAAWLDQDEYGYKCCYKTVDDETNWSYLVTHFLDEALYNMREEIKLINAR